MRETAKSLNIDNEISILEGGSVGIAIYPCEWDKVQVLSSLTQYKEIQYFGDKYKLGGNDHDIIHHEKVIGHKIDNKHNTYALLKNIINKE